MRLVVVSSSGRTLEEARIPYARTLKHVSLKRKRKKRGKEESRGIEIERVVCREKSLSYYCRLDFDLERIETGVDRGGFTIVAQVHQLGELFANRISRNQLLFF